MNRGVTDMKYLLIRDEKSVQEVADKAYKKLTPAARKKAEADLVKANPELKSFRAVRKGSIVRIPDIREGGEKNTRNLKDPVEIFAGGVLDSLERLERGLETKFDDLKKHRKNTEATLKAANKELKQYPNGEETSKALSKHLSESKKLDDKNRKQTAEALQKLQKTVAAMDH